MDDATRDFVLRGLAQILDILDAPSPWHGACSCGWRGAEWEAEADANAEMWAHDAAMHPSGA